jgi:hypothetical protein
MTEKKIIIKGTNNRRQIKHLLGNKTDSQKKNVLPIEDKYFDENEQLNIIDNMYSFLDMYIQNEIKAKISSYKQQDKTKGVYSIDSFISYERIISLLQENKCKCIYCKENMLIFYKNKNNNKQWTLDRIDNAQGHNFDNVTCSCLHCNIQKRDRDHEKFLYTKSLKIHKI